MKNLPSFLVTIFSSLGEKCFKIFILNIKVRFGILRNFRCRMIFRFFYTRWSHPLRLTKQHFGWQTGMGNVLKIPFFRNFKTPYFSISQLIYVFDPFKFEFKHNFLIIWVQYGFILKKCALFFIS